MTDQELLQQCKDEVAQTAEYKEGVKYEKWEELMAAIAIDYYQEPFALSFQQLMYSHKASLQAIQSAREEAYRYGFIDGDHEHNEMALEPCLQEYLKRINTAD